MDKDILESLKKCTEEINELMEEVSVKLNEKSELLKNFESTEEINKDEYEKVVQDIADIKSEVKAIKEDLSKIDLSKIDL